METRNEIYCKGMYGNVDNKTVIISFCIEVSKAEQN